LLLTPPTWAAFCVVSNAQQKSQYTDCDISSCLSLSSENICRANERSIDMADAEKIIVVQFKQARGDIMPGDMRPASSAASAEKMASAMATAAYAVTVDEESGSMANPRLVVSHGQIADLMLD